MTRRGCHNGSGGGGGSAGLSPNALLEVGALSQTFANAPFSGAAPVRTGGSTTSMLVTMGQTLFASGESVALRILKNGVPVGSTVTLTSATTIGMHDFSSSLGTIALLPGDQLTANGVYTPGGTPNSPSFSVSIQWR